jgi:hypothetical protein
MIGQWRRQSAPAEKARANDPIAVLSLSAAADLTDDDVRAAWRRIAAERPLRSGSTRGRRPLRTRGLLVGVRNGRPGRLALRVCGAAAVAVIAMLAAGHGPAGPAVAAGAATWLILTVRNDVA